MLWLHVAAYSSGVWYPKELCGRCMLYSIRHCSTSTFASSRLPKSSRLRHSSRSLSWSRAMRDRLPDFFPSKRSQPFDVSVLIRDAHRSLFGQRRCLCLSRSARLPWTPWGDVDGLHLFLFEPVLQDFGDELTRSLPARLALRAGIRQSTRAAPAATCSGPLSLRMCSGIPYRSMAASTTVMTSTARMLHATWVARH